MLIQRGLVARRAARKRERLDQADLAQDVQSPVDRPETHPGQIDAYALVNGLRGKVAALIQGAQDGSALLGKPVTRLQQAGIDGIQTHLGGLPRKSRGLRAGGDGVEQRDPV